MSQPSQIPNVGRSVSISRTNVQKSVNDRVSNLEREGRSQTKNTGVNSSPSAKSREEKRKAEEDARYKKNDEKLDMLINLMGNVGSTLKENTTNIENVGENLKNHIDKYNNDIKNIHEHLKKIEENAINIKKNADDIVDIVNDLKVMKSDQVALETEVKESVVGVSEKVDRINEKFTDELAKKPNYEEIEVRIKEAVTKETAHLHEIIKNLINDADKNNAKQLNDTKFPELDIAAGTKTYAMTINNVQKQPTFQPPGISAPKPQQLARQNIRNTFE